MDLGILTWFIYIQQTLEGQKFTEVCVRVCVCVCERDFIRKQCGKEEEVVVVLEKMCETVGT